MHKFIKSTLILVISTLSLHSHAASWVPVTPVSDLKGFVVDKDSIRSYPGLVTFITAHKISNDGDYYLQKVAMLCKTKDILGIASGVSINEKLLKINLIPEVQNVGIIQYLSAPALIKYVQPNCGKTPSKIDEEIPITNTKSEIYFLLPKETQFTSGLISIWKKKYQFKSEPYLVNGTQLEHNGERIEKTTIIRDGAYNLQRDQFNCKDRTSRIMQLTEYKSDGTINKSTNFEDFSKFEQPIPNSIGYQTLEIVCDLK